MNRRNFIAALFGTATAITYGDELALPLDNVAPPETFFPGPLVRPYCYTFMAEMVGQQIATMELSVSQNFWLRSIDWSTPMGAISEIRAGGVLLARSVLPANLYPASMRLIVPIAVPAQSAFTITLQNLPGNVIRHPAGLLLSGIREMSQDQIERPGDIDAEFEEDNSDE